jgi:hypothetical protein
MPVQRELVSLVISHACRRLSPALEEWRSGLGDDLMVPKKLHIMKARCRIECSRCMPLYEKKFEARLCVCAGLYSWPSPSSGSVRMGSTKLDHNYLKRKCSCTEHAQTVFLLTALCSLNELRGAVFKPLPSFLGVKSHRETILSWGRIAYVMWKYYDILYRDLVYPQILVSEASAGG